MKCERFNLCTYQHIDKHVPGRRCKKIKAKTGTNRETNRGKTKKWKRSSYYLCPAIVATFSELTLYGNATTIIGHKWEWLKLPLSCNSCYILCINFVCKCNNNNGTQKRMTHSTFVS